jgi:hypothetical protein
LFTRAIFPPSINAFFKRVAKKQKIVNLLDGGKKLVRSVRFKKTFNESQTRQLIPPDRHCHLESVGLYNIHHNDTWHNVTPLEKFNFATQYKQHSA